MDYVEVHCLPIEFDVSVDELRGVYFCPILDGDICTIREIGDPIHIDQLIPSLGRGDCLHGDRELLEEILNLNDPLDDGSPWVIRPSYWSGDIQLEYDPVD